MKRLIFSCCLCMIFTFGLGMNAFADCSGIKLVKWWDSIQYGGTHEVYARIKITSNETKFVYLVAKRRGYTENVRVKVRAGNIVEERLCGSSSIPYIDVVIVDCE